jgi:hypothetical protein
MAGLNSRPRIMKVGRVAELGPGFRESLPFSFLDSQAPQHFECCGVMRQFNHEFSPR